MVRKFFLIPLLGTGVLVVALLLGSTYQAFAANGGPFVRAEGTQFTLNGKPFFVAGANNHYIHFAPRTEVDRVLATARDMRLNVMRIWGFLDIGSLDGRLPTTWNAYGPHAYDLNTRGVYFQYWDTVAQRTAYNDGPDGLEHLDYVIAKAGEMGIKLIIVLANNWEHLGGVPQYNAWAGLDNSYQFFTSERTRQLYKDWVAHLINRKNSITGLAYKDDPTIFAWELINEPHIGQTSPQVLTSWVAEMSAYVKSLDPNHLVGLGDEGMFNWPHSSDDRYNGEAGVDFEAILSLPTIDFGTYHLYPDWWKKTPEWGVQWIKDHIAAGRRAGKPVLLEEFGWQDDATKEVVYAQWLETIQAEGGAGWLFWRLVAPVDSGIYPTDTENFDVRYPSSIATLFTQAADRLARAASSVRIPAQTDKPRVFDLMSPGDGAEDVGLNPTFAWEEAAGAEQYSLLLSKRSSFDGDVLVYVSHDTSFTLPMPLEGETSYYWQVVAANAAGTTAARNGPSHFVTVRTIPNSIIDDFENYGTTELLQAAYVPHKDGNTVQVYLDEEYKHDGRFGLRFEYTIGDPEWCGVMKELPCVSWEGSTGIQFWLKPDGSMCSLTIQFGQLSGAYWEAYVPINGQTQPRLIRLPFSSFVRPAWNKQGGSEMDLSAITSFAIYIGRAGGTDGRGTLYFDSFELIADRQ